MSNTDERVVVEEKVTKKVSPTKKAAKKFAPDEAIACRSVTAGELVLVGTKTKMQYTWADYGDVAYVEYQDLQTLQSMRSGFLVKPRFIIEDDELVEQWSAMLKPIYNAINEHDVEALLVMQPNKLRGALANLPDGLKEALKTKAAQMIKTEELNDIRVIKVIDEVLGTELMESILN